MIADVTFERTVYQGRPTASRPAPATSPTPWAWARPATTSNASAWRTSALRARLLAYATERLRPIPGVRLIGTAADKASVLSFVLPRHGRGGAGLNREGIAVRTGHHCAQPILRRLGVEATVRPRWPSTTPVKRWTASSQWCSAWQRPPLKLSAPRSSQSRGFPGPVRRTIFSCLEARFHSFRAVRGLFRIRLPLAVSQRQHAPHLALPLAHRCSHPADRHPARLVPDQGGHLRLPGHAGAAAHRHRVR
jgi:hypothetical protein